MTLILPAQVAPASSWELHDYRTVAGRSTPAAGGVATLELEVDPDELWLLDHAAITCTSSTPTSARVYVGSVADTALLSGTGSGNVDEADYPNGLHFNGSNVVVQWTGAADGAIGTLVAQVRVLRRS